MESTPIFVPLFVWLIGGSRIGGTYNTYFGSCTEHPDQAAWGQKIFNYSIAIEKIDEREIIKASVYGGLQSFSAAQAADELTTEAFPCEESSLPEVRDWLETQRKQFFSES